MKAPASYVTRHHVGEMLATHRHARAYASLVLEGSHVEASADGPVACEPGTLILHPAFHAHGNRFGRLGARVVNLDLPMDLAPAAVRILQVSRVAAAHAVFERAPQHLPALLAGATPRATDHAPADWHAAFVQALAHGDDPVATIARRLGVSAAHASRALAASHGMPPQLLRRELRLRRALALLPGDAPLAQVAALAGFADQSHLTRVVRRCSGLPPAALRRRIKSVQDRAPAAMAQ